MADQCTHNTYLHINPIAASISTFVILIYSFMFPNFFLLHIYVCVYVSVCGQDRSG